MGFFNKIKQFILNQSDSYRFYEYEYKKNNEYKKIKKDFNNNEKKIRKLERDLNNYKKQNDMLMHSYNEQFNTLFLFTDFEPKGHLKYNHLLNQELLNFVVNICDKYNLQYWLDFGTLLGAIRHNGFVPWDDDMDIAMMRRDYDRFLEVLPQELKDNNLDDVIDVTINISNVKPIPCIQLLYQKDQKNVPGLLAGIDISVYDFIDDIKNCNKESYKRIQNIVRSKNKEGIPIYEAVKDYIKEFNISYEKQKYIIPGVDGFIEAFPSYQFFIAEYNQIFPLKEIKFENSMYAVPNNYRFYLNKLYGDYLTIPKKIHTHHFRWKILREREDGIEIYKTQVDRLKKVNEEFK